MKFLLKRENNIEMLNRPSCDIYLNVKTGDYIIENHAIDKKHKWCTSYGNLIFISLEDMKNNGLTLTIRSLHGFSKREKKEKSELEKMSPYQQKIFSKKHKLVGVTLENSSRLVLIPMHRNRSGGHEGHIDTAEEVILPCSNNVFMEKLTKAFDKC